MGVVRALVTAKTLVWDPAALVPVGVTGTVVTKGLVFTAEAIVATEVIADEGGRVPSWGTAPARI